jgi:ABC-type lipoprotein export system ATPase subunit
VRPVVELQAISKVYGGADVVVRAVDGVDLVVERGDYLAVMGASGSGKSTLMNIIGCLDVPTSGATCSTASTRDDSTSGGRRSSATARSGSSSSRST